MAPFPDPDGLIPARAGQIRQVSDRAKVVDTEPMRLDGFLQKPTVAGDYQPRIDAAGKQEFLFPQVAKGKYRAFVQRLDPLQDMEIRKTQDVQIAGRIADV